MNRRDFLTTLGMAAAANARGQQAPKPDFTLRIGPVSVEPKPGKTVKTIGYNGTVPGPLIRCREGQTITIEAINNSPYPERCTGTACVARPKWMAPWKKVRR